MLVTTLACVGVAAPLAAQVGHVPQRSPYIDLEYRQEASLFGGYYNAGTDEELRTGGALCDVGPTILRMLGIEQPDEMTGMDLRLSGVSA